MEKRKSYTWDFVKNIESFLPYLQKKLRKEIQKTNKSDKTKRNIFTIDQLKDMYTHDSKFKEYTDNLFKERQKKYLKNKSKSGKRAHEIHGEDLLKRSIHTSESQSKSGKKGGDKNVETGWINTLISLGQIAQARLRVEDSPEGEAFREKQRINGVNSRRTLNKRTATCTVCGKTGQFPLWVKNHSVDGYPDHCGGKRIRSQKEIEAGKAFGEKGKKNLIKSSKKRSEEFKNLEKTMFSNVPEVFSRKEFDAIGKSLNIKTNYGYLNNTEYYEKFGHGKYRKVGSSAVFKTDKEVETDLVYNKIPINLNFTKKEAAEYCKDLNISIKSIGYMLDSRKDLFKLVVRGNCKASIYTKKY